MLNLFVLSITFAASALGQGDVFQPYPTCTTTITHADAECCPPVPTATKTVYTDCGGCALTSETIPLNCFVPCTTTSTSGRTTVTKCGSTPTPSLSTSTRNGTSSIAVNPRGPLNPCTSTITEFQNPCGGCFSTTYEHSSTVTTDCSGCVLATTTTHADVGVCLRAKRLVCPNGKVQTVTDQGTKTVTACAATSIV